MRGNVWLVLCGLLALLLLGCQAEQMTEPTLPAVITPTSRPVMATATMEATNEPTAVPATPTNPPQATDEAMNDQPVIIYKQSGGFAGLEQEWRIFANGLYEGSPATRSTLPPDAIAQILADAEAGGFFELPDSYLVEGHCCDFFNLEVTLVDENGRSHTITTMESTPGMPDILQQTIHAINLLLFLHEVEE